MLVRRSHAHLWRRQLSSILTGLSDTVESSTHASSADTHAASSAAASSAAAATSSDHTDSSTATATSASAAATSSAAAASSAAASSSSAAAASSSHASSATDSAHSTDHSSAASTSGATSASLSHTLPSGASSTLTSASQSSSSSGSSGPGAGTVVGIVAASLVGLVVIAGLLGYFLRTRWGSKHDDDVHESPFGNGGPPYGQDDDEDLDTRRRTSTLLSGEDLDAQMYHDPTRPRPPSMIERHMYAASPTPMLQPGQVVNPAMYQAYPPPPPPVYPDQSGINRAYSSAAYSYYGRHANQQQQDYPAYPLPVTTSASQDPFSEHVPEDVIPSRSGTPLNPNLQTYYRSNIDPAMAFPNSVNNTDHFAQQPQMQQPGYVSPTRQNYPLDPITEANTEGEPSRALSVRNGGLDARNHNDARPASTISDAYGGI